jgi:hypothetical protein
MIVGKIFGTIQYLKIFAPIQTPLMSAKIVTSLIYVEVAVL